jgi:polyisoprenoid-binding protein YceI
VGRSENFDFHGFMVLNQTRNTLTRAAVVFALAAPPSLHAQEAVLELDPAQTQIEFTLAEVFHPVHGTFKLKSGTVRFDPATGKAGGLVVIDLTSGKSDNPGLDRKMHKAVLESRKYPEATFTPVRVFGRLEAQGESPVQLNGILKLHGNEHDLMLATTMRRDGNQLTASTHLVIPYVEWGLKNPSTLFLHVSDKVDIDIKTVCRITLPEAQK